MNHCMWITRIQFTCEHKQTTCMCTHVHTKFTRMWCTWLMYMCCIEHVANLYCIFRYIYVRMYNIYYCNFLNQACTSLWQMHAWLLKNLIYADICMFVCVNVCVCLPLRLLITSGIIWTTYDWVNKFYSSYMTTVVRIIIWSGIGINTNHGN